MYGMVREWRSDLLELDSIAAGAASTGQRYRVPGSQSICLNVDLRWLGDVIGLSAIAMRDQ